MGLEKDAFEFQKGQVVIPKDIRDKLGITECYEVIANIINDSIVIGMLKPESVSYVDYYSSTYSKKPNRKVDLKEIVEEQY